MNIRQYDTGANRNSSKGKFVYKDFINPLNDYSFASYMHGKRMLPDGTERAGDNWQNGIPKNDLLDSLVRHVEELKLIMKGYNLKRYNDDDGEHTIVEPEWATFEGDEVDIEEVLNAIRFNSEAIKLQILEDDLKHPNNK